MKLISIIVPIYNAMPYLLKCVNSIVNQTYKDWELILIDDGSSDDSSCWCNHLAYGDNRIKVIHLTPNGGPSGARNAGINHAKGEYITFVDADDYIEPNALQLLMSAPADLVMGDYHISNKADGGYLLSVTRYLTKEDIHSYLTNYMKRPFGYALFVYCWANLYKTSIIKEHDIRFNTDMHVFEDGVFIMDYLRYVETAYYIQARIYNYVYTEHQLAEFWIYHNPLVFIDFAEAIGSYLGTYKIGQACVSFAIKQMIRHFTVNGRRDRIRQSITSIVNNDDIQRWLNSYKPGRGDSWLIPLFMKLKWITPLMWACKLRAR